MYLLTTFFLTTLACLFTAVPSRTAPVPLLNRDVFVPQILSPNASTVWQAGSKQNVTWSTADAPVNITNGRGIVVFAKDDRMFTDEPGGLNNPLASGFDILLGSIEVTVPNVEPDDDYQIVLFGDSGNFSPEFTITY